MTSTCLVRHAGLKKIHNSTDGRKVYNFFWKLQKIPLVLNFLVKFFMQIHFVPCFIL